MLKGNSPDIISQNVRDLCRKGMGEKQATHLAMKHANKGTKKQKSVVDKVVAADPLQVK